MLAMEDRLIYDRERWERILELKRKEWVERTVDALFKHSQVPVRGSILYCNLAVAAEHTGIYVGRNQVVHLDGSGYVRKVSLHEFVNRLDGMNPAFSVFCSVDKRGRSFGGERIAKRAESFIGKRTKYNLLTNNCHRFTGFCLTGGKNVCTTFTGLKRILDKAFHADQWRAVNMP